MIVEHFIKTSEWRDKLSKEARDILADSDPIYLYEEKGKIHSKGLYEDEWDTLDEAIADIEFILTEGIEE